MKTARESRAGVGCLALLLVAGGGIWLATRNPDAGTRGDRAAALREACIERGRGAFRAGHAGAEPSRQQAADLVGRCFSEARRRTE